MYRVLYIEGSGDTVGGGQISLLKLLENIDRGRVQPILLCPFKGNLMSRVEELGILVKTVRMDSPKRNPLTFISSVIRLRELIRGMKVNLVHANTSRSLLCGGLAAKQLGVPVIWHARIIESEGLYDKFLAGLCTKIIVVSRAVRERFSWLLKKQLQKVLVVHNGVDLQEFNPAINGEGIRKEFDLLPGIPVVGVVGNLILGKGQEYFIQAAAEVTQVIPDVKFFIVGDGECRESLERLTDELGLRGNVIFTGRRSDVPRVIAAMSVFVHTSVTPEAFGRVILEAMAMAKPIVAINEGGVPEMIEDGTSGILIPPRNSSVMAQAIIGLLHNRKTARKIGLAARRRVKESFSIEESVKKTEEIYAQILNRQ